MARSFSTPEECPVCGESVPRNAKACPHCGADERSGWNEEQTRYDGLDLPETAFEDEAGSRRTPHYKGGKMWIVVTILLLFVLFLSLVLR